MGKQEIIDRILSDAESEAQAIIAEAQRSADETISAANAKIAAERAETEAEIALISERVASGRAAAARLDSAKILLAEKRRVIDEIYSRALERLLSLGEKDYLKIVEKMIAENAEEGDLIVLSADFKYADGVKNLPVVAKLGLKISPERAPIRGGVRLCGKLSDKDLSFAALLGADLDEHQAELAARLFRE